MRKITQERKQKAQKKYRKVQSNKGLKRFELQVSEESKARFDEMVKAAADDYPEPWDSRRRIAKARASVFDEITQGVIREFHSLKDQIESLKAQISALSPSFFKSDEAEDTRIPDAIIALPDSPEQLKKILSKIYRESQQTKLNLREANRQAKQYQELYEAMSNYNDELVKKYDLSE